MDEHDYQRSLSWAEQETRPMTQGEKAEKLFLAATWAVEEASKAMEEYPCYHSLHEGYGVLMEEVAELLDEIRANNTPRAVEEAVQVAAVALRIVAEFGKWKI